MVGKIARSRAPDGSRGRGRPGSGRVGVVGTDSLIGPSSPRGIMSQQRNDC